MGLQIQEGWLNDDYLVLFSGTEIDGISQRYDIAQSLPGFAVIGLRGWDDFIVRDQCGDTYTIPAVPIDRRYLQAYSLPEPITLEIDGRFQGKIKWYITPLIFGGDANDPKNLTWVSLEQHAQLVVWWNKKYRAARGRG